MPEAELTELERAEVERIGAEIARSIQVFADANLIGKQRITFRGYQQMVAYVFGCRPEQVTAVWQNIEEGRDHYGAAIRLDRPVERVEMTLRIEQP